MGIRITTRGNFKRTRRFLKKASDNKIFDSLVKYAQKGAEALAAATPVESGATANAWRFEVAYGNGSAKINWINDNINEGLVIALLIQYGHGTGTGGWVEGRDYINPAIQPIFDEIRDKVWKEVTEG